MGEKAKLSSVVHIHYKGGVKGEEPQDISVDGEPLTVMLGAMSLPRGVEQAIIGMEVGEEKEVDISVADGYGEYQEGLAQWYPRMKMPDGYNLHVGDVLFRTNPDDGSKIPFFIVDETADNVRADPNHPFAGCELHYWIRLEAIG